MKKLLVAIAVGAILTWLFDPDSGARRRTQLRRRLEARRSPAAPLTVSPGVVEDAPTLLTGTR